MIKKLHELLKRRIPSYARHFYRREVFREIDRLGDEIRTVTFPYKRSEDLIEQITVQLDQINEKVIRNTTVHNLQMRSIQVYYRTKDVEELEKIRDTLADMLEELTMAKLAYGIK